MEQITKIAIQKAGGPVKVAKVLRISHQAVGAWRAVPAKHATMLARLSGIRREKLRPDIFG